MKIYWAAPLFTMAERTFNTQCASHLRTVGKHEVHLPQDAGSSEGPGETYQRCVRALEVADVVVACLDGPDPDSGTSWEVGYACAKGKPVVVFRTDDRLAELPGHGRCNLMLLESATAHLTAWSRMGPHTLMTSLENAVDMAAEIAGRGTCT